LRGEGWERVFKSIANGVLEVIGEGCNYPHKMRKNHKNVFYI